MPGATHAKTGRNIWPGEPRRGWTARQLAQNGIAYGLTAAEQAALRALVTRTMSLGRPLTTITRHDFASPLLDPLWQRLADDLRHGPGLVLITGIAPGDYDAQELRLLYWGIGTHFGDPVSQNILGDRLGEVRVRDDTVVGRAYNQGGPLAFHSDRIDMLSLFALRQARSGGANMFVSSLKVWDIVEQERPDLMPWFARGFYQHLGNEHASASGPVTLHRLPIFGSRDGLRSCLFSGNASLAMQRDKLADRLTAAEEEALVYLRSVVDRPELAFRLMLEDGEMVFINNYEVLHAREDFEDDPAQRRFLLRLWLQGRPWRPKPDTMMCYRNASGEQGIDRRPVESPIPA